MGYVEETGAAQHLRDARILPIYEGTNGIQANDLVFRKLKRDGGAEAAALGAEIAAEAAALAATAGQDLSAIGKALGSGAAALAEASRYLAGSEPETAAAGSSPYLGLLGTLAAGWLLAAEAREARRRAAGNGDATGFLGDKVRTARFFAEHFLASAPGLLPAVKGGATVLGFAPERL
jgi:acyl-CoA dehydrogenase